MSIGIASHAGGGRRACELTPITWPWELISGPPAFAWSIGGVGLDRVCLGRRVGGVDPVLDGADDADGGGAVEVAGVADRDHRVADLDRVGVAERQRAERARVGVDLEHRDVGRGVVADKRRVELVAAGEADLEGAGAGDHRLLVTMCPALSITKPEPRDWCAAAAPAARALIWTTPGRVEAVDLLHRQPAPSVGERRAAAGAGVICWIVVELAEWPVTAAPASASPAPAPAAATHAPPG